ncbi:hypothetical protein BG003_003619, partial [Podila horticola]
ASARKGAKLPHTSVFTTGPRGPLPATAPTLEQRDNVPWMTFSYSRKGHINTRYSIRIDIDQMHLTDILPDFQTRNCLYPMANGPEQAYKGVRRDYERECNVQGWRLAYLNPVVLDGERGLLQRAVNSFRNLDEGNRSRRMRRRDKVANGTLQKRTARPVMDFRREGVEPSVQAPCGQQARESRGRQGHEGPDEDVGVGRVARERVPVGLKWKQILVPPLDGSSQGPIDLVVTDPSIPDDTPIQEAAVAASNPLPPAESTNAVHTSLPDSLPDHLDNVSLLEFQGYIQGKFQPLQIIVSFDQVQLDSLDFEFKKRNCVYPRSFLDTHESPHWNTFGIRQAEESYLNEIGWKLCLLNQTLLDGKKLLLQQALDAYRRKFLPVTAQPRARIGLGLLTTRRRSISGLPPTAPLPTVQLLKELNQEQQEEEPGQSSSHPPKAQNQTQRVRFNVQERSRRRTSASAGNRPELSGGEEQEDSEDSSGVLREGQEETDELEGQVKDDDDDEITEQDDDDDDGDEEESGEGSSSEDVYHSQMSLLSFTGAIQTYSLGTGSGSARSRPRIAPAKTIASGTPPISQKRLADRTLARSDKRPKLGKDKRKEPAGHNTGNTGSGSRRSTERSEVTDNAEGGLGLYLPENDQQEEDDWWMSRLHSSHHPKDHYLVNMTTEELIGALTSGYNSDDDDDDDDDDDEEEEEEDGGESGNEYADNNVGE